jgi:hypothetical protein
LRAAMRGSPSGTMRGVNAGNGRALTLDYPQT